MYKIVYTNPVEKDIKSLSVEIRDVILNKYFPLLSKNPFCGKFLKGEFNKYLSYSFIYKSVEYRIIYQVFKDKLLILVVMVSSRENIYKRLKRRK